MKYNIAKARYPRVIRVAFRKPFSEFWNAMERRKYQAAQRSCVAIMATRNRCPWAAWRSVPEVHSLAGSLLSNKYSEPPSRATSLPDIPTRTIYVAGQHALSDSMSCFACVKSLRDAIGSISPFSNRFRTIYTAHLCVGEFEENTAPF